MKEWKVGDFATKRDTLVRLHSEPTPGRFTVEFVSNYEHGAGVCCGGYCSCYSVEELSLVTDVEQLILCSAYEAMKNIEAAKKEIQAQEAIFSANKAALAAFKKAREISQTIGY